MFVLRVKYAIVILWRKSLKNVIILFLRYYLSRKSILELEYIVIVLGM